MEHLTTHHSILAVEEELREAGGSWPVIWGAMTA
jgi:hypothetical protein